MIVETFNEATTKSSFNDANGLTTQTVTLGLYKQTDITVTVSGTGTTYTTLTATGGSGAGSSSYPGPKTTSITSGSTSTICSLTSGTSRQTSTTLGPADSSITKYTWYFGASNTKAANRATLSSSSLTGSHSSLYFLSIPNQSLIVTPIVPQGISTISFWVYAPAGTGNVVVGMRTITTATAATTTKNFSTYPISTVPAKAVFSSVLSTYANLATQSYTFSTATTVTYNEKQTTKTGGGFGGSGTLTVPGASNSGGAGLGTDTYSAFQVIFTVPQSQQGSAGQIAIMANGGTINIDDIEIFGGATPGTWTGRFNTDWNNINNWTYLTVPTTTTDVIIPNVTNQPVLPNDVEIHNLTMNASATLDLGGNTLTIDGAASGSGQLITSSTTSSIVMGIASSGTLNFATTPAAYLANLTLLSGATSATLTIGAGSILEVNNLTLNSSAFGASLLNLNSETLTIDGTISGSGKLGGSLTSNIELGGSATGTLNFFTGLAFLNDLTLDPGAKVSLGSSLAIASTGVLTIGTGSILTAGTHLILESDNSGSARVAAIPVNGTGVAQGSITGTVSVLCYIHSTLNAQGITTARRAWRLLTAPISNFGLGTQTKIYTSWQTNGISLPLQGTFVTGPPSAITAADGLDEGINGNYSMYTWDAAMQKLVAVASPKTMNISNATGTADNIAYFTFIRGDRTASLIASPNGTNQTNTTLTAAGTLMEGDQLFSSTTGIISAATNGLSMIGNPFASSIDFSYIAGDIGGGTAQFYSGLSNIYNRFYVWNSNLLGSSGVGGYQCIDDQSYSGTYLITADSLTGAAAGSAVVGTNNANLNIQSGQAFFVQTKTTGAASINIKEAAKSTVNNFVFRPATVNIKNTADQFATSLSLVNSDGSTALTDGVVAQFGNGYCACVDDLDAPKFTNFDEMFSLQRDEQQLSIERRPEITDKDTLFLALQQMQQRAYQFKFTGTIPDHIGLGAHVEDSYTGIHTPLNLNGTNQLNFTIDTSNASRVMNRFMIVFGDVNTAPDYTTINATRKSNTVLVQWAVSNDTDMANYTLQRSTDGGNTYTTVDATIAQHITGTYNWTDMAPVAGRNYYRILSMDKLGEQSYSRVVYADINTFNTSGITVFPNPIQNAQIGIALNTMPEGIYLYELDNKLGQVIQTGTLNHPGGNANDIIALNKAIARGSYLLKIIAPDNTVTAINILY